ncbi:MAG: NUDIX pyrophosphatase [Dehalococcoidales bacterium]|jgi:dATP pyrophosphohydrolase|nr:NUDIX pyrophosphatase [Dehalococcoidales bacterium]
MSRAPFQVLVVPFFRNKSGRIEFAIFKRRDGGYWQGIAGGGEDNETPAETAKRETQEESGIHEIARYITLDTICSVPVTEFPGAMWGDSIYVIPEYFFAVEVMNKKITLSDEHTEYRWVKYKEAVELLKWDSNKTALWELNQRLMKNSGKSG